MKLVFFCFLLIFLKPTNTTPTNCDYTAEEVNINGNCETLSDCSVNTPKFIEVDADEFATCVPECTSRIFELVTGNEHFKCIDNCTEFVQSVDQSLACLTECSTDPFTWYQDGGNKVCTTDCDGAGRPFFYADGANKRCTNGCSGGEYIKLDSTSGLKECLTECSTDPFTWYQDGGNKTCTDDCDGLGRPFFYADGNNKRCTDGCAINEYIKLDSTSGLKECLTECETNSFTWYEDGGNKICTTDCDGLGKSFFYADGNNKRCTDNCVGNEYHKLDTTSGLTECLSECSANPFTWYEDGGNKVCTTDCSGANKPFFYADGNNKRCVDGCSGGEYIKLDSTSGLKQCLSECSVNPFTWYQDGNDKVCESNCSGANKPYFYADGNNKRCVDACSTGEYIKLDSTSGLKQCVSECSTDPFTWYQDGNDKVCESNCSGTGKPFYYEDGANKRCVTGCAQNEYIKLDAASGLKQCLQSCSTGSFTWYQDGSNKVCESNCSGTGKPFYYEDGANKKCVNQCASTEYSKLDNASGLRECLTQCETGPFFFLPDGTDKQCKDVCPQTHKFFSVNGQAKECKTACQAAEYSGTPDNNAGGVAECLSSCNTGTFFYILDGTSKKCKTTCTEANLSYYKNTGGDANQCLSVCPTGEYAKSGLNGNYQCLSTCDTGPFYYSESNNVKLCISEASCKSDYHYFIEVAANFQCFTACPSDNPFKKEIQTDFFQCLAICPDKEKSNECVTGTCANQVYSTFTNSAGQTHLSCVDSCPTTAPYLPTTYNNEVESFTCTASCLTKYAKIETLGARCLASAACPSDTTKLRTLDAEKVIGSTPVYTSCYASCPTKGFVLGSYCAPKCESHEKTLSIAAAEKYSSAFCQMICYADLFEEAYSTTGHSTIMCVEKCTSGFVNISNRRQCTPCDTEYAILQATHSICTNRTDCKVNIGDGQNYRVVFKEDNSLGFNECVLGCDLKTQKEFVTSNGDKKCISCTKKLDYLGNCVSTCKDNEIDDGKYCVNCRMRNAYFYKGECISSPNFPFVLLNSEFNAINKCSEFDALFAEYNGSCQRCPTGYAILAAKCINLVENKMFDRNGFAQSSCSQDETPVNRVCTKTEELLKPKTFKYDHLIQKMGCAANQVRVGTKCVDCYLTSQFVLDFDKVCRSKCTAPYVPDSLNQKCLKCNSITVNSLFEDGKCVSACSAGLVSQQGVCTKCPDNQVIMADKCTDTCPTGYSTDSNNQCIATGDCSITPCFNEGICTNNICKCKTGFAGDKCEITASQAATITEVKRNFLRSQGN